MRQGKEGSYVRKTFGLALFLWMCALFSDGVFRTGNWRVEHIVTNYGAAVVLVEPEPPKCVTCPRNRWAVGDDGLRLPGSDVRDRGYRLQTA